MTKLTEQQQTALLAVSEVLNLVPRHLRQKIEPNVSSILKGYGMNIDDYPFLLRERPAAHTLEFLNRRPDKIDVIRYICSVIDRATNSTYGYELKASATMIGALTGITPRSIENKWSARNKSDKGVIASKICGSFGENVWLEWSKTTPLTIAAHEAKHEPLERLDAFWDRCHLNRKNTDGKRKRH